MMVLDAPVSGTNLVPGRLRDQLGDAPALLVFLRHLRLSSSVARRSRTCAPVAERDAAFPPLVFFTQSSSTELRAFLRRDWPTARAVADPERHFYAAFGVERMSPLGLAATVAMGGAASRPRQGLRRTASAPATSGGCRACSWWKARAWCGVTSSVTPATIRSGIGSRRSPARAAAQLGRSAAGTRRPTRHVLALASPSSA